ncbi:biopolymer transporter ExbD [Candidatus Phycosocius spiralis]|uniref:Biopolymer transporter ExbD n=1 Tax=Candidatus Phycosocius spiralis TaxID=2815099 RepID=A0ABQ4PU07_9PROT|nr:biopolymer transporter ExbD [Candidatus Phycosocius spiralis]GIU66384.1 biopolymer transporter ExbD [Candidatus Phycosocius spiralis]
MGAKLSGGRRKGLQPSSEPNIVPFIDILLVLLIIFMVAAPIPTTDVKVDLPPPVPPKEQPVKPKTPTVVDIRDDGTGVPQIFVDGQLTEPDQLAAKVLERITFHIPDSPNRLLETVRVRADQTLPYASVMETMGILQEADFQKVSLVAEDAISTDQLR